MPPKARGTGLPTRPQAGRGGAHDAEERVEGQLRAPGQAAEAAGGVDVGVDGLVLGELVRQGAEERQDRHEAPVEAELQVEDVDLQHVARLGALHVDGAGDEVRAGAPLQGVEGVEQVGRHPGGVGVERLAPARRMRVQGDGVARFHGQHGRQRGVEIAEHHGLGRRGDLVMGRHGGSFYGCQTAM